jgi:hypothetical protein
VAKKTIAERIRQIQSQLGRHVELSRPAAPSRVLEMTMNGIPLSIPVYDEGYDELEVQCGELAEVSISAEEVVLTLITSNGGISWTVTPDTRMVLLS